MSFKICMDLYNNIKTPDHTCHKLVLKENRQQVLCEQETEACFALLWKHKTSQMHFAFSPCLYAFSVNFREMLFDKYIGHPWGWARIIITAFQTEKQKQKSEMTCWELPSKSLSEKGLGNSTFQRSLSAHFSKPGWFSFIILK